MGRKDRTAFLVGSGTHASSKPIQTADAGSSTRVPGPAACSGAESVSGLYLKPRHGQAGSCSSLNKLEGHATITGHPVTGHDWDLADREEGADLLGGSDRGTVQPWLLARASLASPPPWRTRYSKRGHEELIR